MNTKIEKYQAPAKRLPAKTKAMIKKVMETHYSKERFEKGKPFEKEKLSVKRITAFKNSAIVYRMKMLDNRRPNESDDITE